MHIGDDGIPESSVCHAIPTPSIRLFDGCHYPQARGRFEQSADWEVCDTSGLEIGAMISACEPQVQSWQEDYFQSTLRPMKLATFTTVAVLLLNAFTVIPADAEDPFSVPAPSGALSLIPWPKSVEMLPGSVLLDPQSRIVAGDVQLHPLAEILAEEIFLATGLKLASTVARPAAGDIVLQIDPRLNGEAYTLKTGTSVEIRGGNFGAVAWGTVTLLQLLSAESDQVSLPRLSVIDAPATEFRGLLVDVARRYHSLESLKQMVRLCRLYKIRYLQLHLTDDQSFMFPSRAFPQLATKNENGGKTYNLEELNDLVTFADARNVTIIPEYEVPGHSAAANRAMPDLFLIKGTKPYVHHASINFAKPEVMQAVATIVGEMCEVFQSSPYFHIGGDEADLAFANQNEDFQAAFRKFNLPNQHQLYRKFVADMNEIVKKNGKQMIVWEGFGREPKSPVQIPKDIIVMAYEIRFYMPDQLVQDGYPVINASWTPLYVVNRGRPPEEIYAWQLRQFKPYGAKPTDHGVIVPPDAPVFGAQMCAWEQPEAVELPNERLRLAAMSERIWNPAAGKSYSNFARRLAVTDKLLDRLVHRFTVHADGLIRLGEYRVDQPITLTLALAPETHGTLRYTLDGQAPGPGSAAYTGPIHLTTTTDFKACVFDEANRPLGYPRSTRYEFHPVHGEAHGLFADNRVSEPLTLTLKSTTNTQYLLFNRAPGQGMNQSIPATLGRQQFADVLAHFPNRPTARIQTGLSYVFSCFRTPPETTLEALRIFLEAAEQTDTPVLVQIDTEHWWEARPDLWNWWDPAQPGYNPANRENVEWTAWSPTNALKLAWRNWGRQIRVLPPPNLASPRYMAACREEIRRLVSDVMDWQARLPPNKKHLLIGIKLGHETSIGVNSYHYPSGNNLLPRPASADPVRALNTEDVLARGMAQIGYAALTSSGIRTNGVPTESELRDVAHRYLEMLCRTAAQTGVPRERLFAHGAGWKEGELIYDVPVNRYACPGWSFYKHAADPRKDAGVQRNLAKSDAPYWAATEWLFQGKRKTAAWRNALANTLSDPRCRYVCVFNWESIRSSEAVLKAITDLVEASTPGN